MKLLDCALAHSINTLVVRIDNFEALLGNTDAVQIAEVVSEIYQQVDEAAQANGVHVVDRRNDRFVFISNNEEYEESSECAGQRFEQLLAVALDLNKRLPATEALQSLKNLKLTMGMASGSASLLCAGREGAWEATSTLGVHGDAVHTASKLAGRAAAGTVAVDGSALRRWAAAARSLPPPSSVVECEGGERRRAAVFDLRACAFEHPPPPPPADAARGAPGRSRSESEAGRLRRSISYA